MNRWYRSPLFIEFVKIFWHMVWRFTAWQSTWHLKMRETLYMQLGALPTRHYPTVNNDATYDNTVALRRIRMDAHGINARCQTLSAHTWLRIRMDSLKYDRCHCQYMQYDNYSHTKYTKTDDDCRCARVDATPTGLLRTSRDIHQNATMWKWELHAVCHTQFNRAC